MKEKSCLLYSGEVFGISKYKMKGGKNMAVLFEDDDDDWGSDGGDDW